MDVFRNLNITTTYIRMNRKHSIPAPVQMTSWGWHGQRERDGQSRQVDCQRHKPPPFKCLARAIWRLPDEGGAARACPNEGNSWTHKCSVVSWSESASYSSSRLKSFRGIQLQPCFVLPMKVCLSNEVKKKGLGEGAICPVCTRYAETEYCWL